MQHRYGEADVEWLLANYGRYVVESGEDGQAVYRLYHQRLVEHLRETNPGGEAAARRVALALLELNAEETAGGSRPELANPYLRRHLAVHAVTGGQESLATYRRLAEAYMPDLAELLT